MPKWQSKKDNPEKLTTQGTQDEENQSKNTTQYVLNITMRKQTQRTYIRHEPSYKQLEVKTKRTQFFMRKRTSQQGTQNVKTHNRTTQKTKKMSNTDPIK